MMKYLAIIVLSLALTLPAYASEVTGTVNNTGVSTGIEGFVTTPPTATPLAGEYASTQNVALSGGARTLSIRYTTDGSPVTNCTSGSPYSTPIPVASSLVIEAISCYANGAVSPRAFFPYAINPPSAPALSVGGGGGGSGGGGGGGGGIATTLATAAYDFNSDGRVDVFDFNVLITNWGSTGATAASGDANGDGNVDILDFNLLIINWKP